MRIVWLLSVILSFLIAASDPGTTLAAPLYSITDLSVLPGQDYSFAEGINNAGIVVGRSGSSADTSYFSRAFVWTPASRMFELLPPQSMSRLYSAIDVNDLGAAVGGGGGPNGFIWTEEAGKRPLPGLRVPLEEWHTGVAINDHGHVAGFIRDIGGASSFYWDGVGAVMGLGHLTPPGPSGIWTEASDINNGDTIVGRERNQIGTMQQAVRWTQATGLRRLAHLPGVTNSSAEGVNDLGQVVGFVPDGIRSSAVTWSTSGAMQFLAAAPGERSAAFDINEQGLIVGYSGFLRAALWTEDGTLHELRTLLDSSGAGWSLAEATAINDVGQIVGWGTNPAGQQRAFLLTPVPEPRRLPSLPWRS